MKKEEYIERYGQEAYNKRLLSNQKCYNSHRDKRLETSKTYYKSHKELCIATSKRYRKNHKQQVAAYEKTWHKQNREYHKEWYDSNRRGDPYNYCCESIDKIENYELAKSDNFIGWDLHHRLEIREGYINTVRDLKIMNIYYNRPACELIYLKYDEHRRLHGQARRLLPK